MREEYNTNMENGMRFLNSLRQVVCVRRKLFSIKRRNDFDAARLLIFVESFSEITLGQNDINATARVCGYLVKRRRMEGDPIHI